MYCAFIAVICLGVVIAVTALSFVKSLRTYISIPMSKSASGDNFETIRQVIVSLTTSPLRISKIKPVIDSIINQTMPPNKIVLNLPYVFKRDNSTFALPLPEFTIQNSKIVINWCEDIGPITKVLPTVHIADNMEDIIISIDDDIEYHPEFIETLLYASEQYPNSVITGSAVHNIKDDSYALAEGYCGILYKKKFLIGFNVEDIKRYPRACYLGDDLTISNYLAKQGIDIILVKNIYDRIWAENRVLDYGNESDALHNSHENNNFNGHDYKTCVTYLKENNDYHIHPGLEANFT